MQRRAGFAATYLVLGAVFALIGRRSCHPPHQIPHPEPDAVDAFWARAVLLQPGYTVH